MIGLVSVSESEGVFVFNHNCHAKRNHVDVDFFVPHPVHLQEEV